MKRKIFTEKSVIQILFWISFIFSGLFYEYTAGFFAGAAALLILIRFRKAKNLVFHWNAATASLLLIVLGYAVSCLWAIDRGLAFIGFLKHTPVLLFLLLLLQVPEAKEQLRKTFPWGMVILTVVSILCSLIVPLQGYFLVAGRLAGFLQYPNTFAMLLLVAQLLFMTEKKFDLKNICAMLVLVGGILYSGSRTVFALAVLTNVVMGLTMLQGKKRWFFVGIFAGGIGLVLLAAYLFEMEVITRYLRFSVSESTFAGRLLYFADALPLVMKYPFGMGYMGYYYVQQSVQTGVYSTMYVHNDLLQLVLDVGWIPAVCWLIAVLRTIFAPGQKMVTRIILAGMFLHSCFDFDLQFTAVYFVFMLFMDVGAGKRLLLRKMGVVRCTTAVLAVCSLWIGMATLFSAIGLRETARAVYPWDTRNNAQLLIETEDLREADAFAQEILMQNEYVNVAYSVRCHYAYSKGDFGKLIEWKQTIFNKFPFQYAEYEEHCRMLINGVALYRNAGDTHSAQVCLQALLDTKLALDTLTQRLSALGKVITDQPVTELPVDILQTIEALQGK